MHDPVAVEAATRDVQGRSHVVELQSLRGLSALVVMLHHCCFYYAYDRSLRRVPELLFNAHAAVVTFFVLSGLVLGQSLLKRPMDAPSSVTFLLRRAFRIYPALWIAGLFALSYSLLFRHATPPAIVSPWWAPGYRAALSGPMAVKTALGINTRLPVPVWTLLIELCGSAIMPIVILAAQRRLALFVAVLLGLAVLSQSVGMTLDYVPIFLVDFPIGAAIALFAPRLRGWLRSDRAAWGMASAGFGLLWFGRVLLGADYGDRYNLQSAALAEAVGAAMLVACVYLRSDLFRPLRAGWAVWLGDCSYSFYLLHMTVIGFVAAIGGEVLRLPVFTGSPLVATLALIMGSLAVAALLAAVSYRFVEVPGIAAGKRLIRFGQTAGQGRLAMTGRGRAGTS